MVSKQRLVELIALTLNVAPSLITDDLSIGDIPEWDSMGHLSIINAVEKEFNVSFDVEQVIDIEDFDDLLESIESLLS